MLGMFGNYDRLERYEIHNASGALVLVVSTIKADDTEHDYETAVSHSELSPGYWTIVEEYDTIEDAELGHKKWIDTMTGEHLPESLCDVSTC